jgi:LPXTG-motif cell wall-anchored protein
MSLLYSAAAADAVELLPSTGASSRALIAIGVALVIGGASILLLIRTDDQGEYLSPPSRPVHPNQRPAAGAELPSPRRRASQHSSGRHAAR